MTRRKALAVRIVCPVAPAVVIGQEITVYSDEFPFKHTVAPPPRGFDRGKHTWVWKDLNSRVPIKWDYDRWSYVLGLTVETIRITP